MLSPQVRIIWFTGLSGAGKSTLCLALQSELKKQGHRVQVLDGDDMRNGLCSDLGFSKEDRTENIRRIAHVAQILSSAGAVVLVATISPLQSMRDMAHSLLPNMLEVFVDASLDVCEQRDPKGLYRLARSGHLPQFTGIDSPFEIPTSAHITCQTGDESVDESVTKLLCFFN